ELHQAQLHRIVAVLARGLPPHHHARTDLQDRHGHHAPVRLKNLRHSNFLSQNSWRHKRAYLCSLPNALISTSTPAGRSSFISASTVCCVGSRMSSKRLCVRISNCSRDFLSAWGDRNTVYLFLIVGSGIGPATLAPVRFAVSTISLVDWSSTR